MTPLGLVKLATATPVGDPPEVRAARRLEYLLVLFQEAHVDPDKTPQGDIVYALATPYEQRGLTSADIERWIDECDPVKKPAWDEVACFRGKVRAAMKGQMGLGTKVALIGAGAFFAGFVLSRARR